MKHKDIFHLVGYENLGFPEIQNIILNYLKEQTTKQGKGEFHIPNQSSPSNFADNQQFNKFSSTPTGLLTKKHMIQTDGVPSHSLTPAMDKCDTSRRQFDEVPSHPVNSLRPVRDKFPPNLNRYINPQVIWIILYMIHRVLTDQRDEKTTTPLGTPINSRVLEDIFGHKRQVQDAKFIAWQCGILDRFGSVRGKYSDRFRISDWRLYTGNLGKVVSRPCDNYNVNKRLIGAYTRQVREHSLDAVSRKSAKILKNLRIHSEPARAFIENYYQQEHKRLVSTRKPNPNAILKLQRKTDGWSAFVNLLENPVENARVVRDDFSGRLYSTFTRSPKELRRFLHFEGCEEELYIVDISNAMAVMLVITLLNEYQQNEWSRFGYEFESVITFLQLLKRRGGEENVIDFISLALQGKFYDEMLRLVYGAQEEFPDMPEQAKRKIKTGLCKQVFYGLNYRDKPRPYRGKVEIVFRNRFEKVWNVITRLKKDDYKALAKELHGREASICIDGVLKELIVKQHKSNILSLHDGFLVPASQVPLVLQTIAQGFIKWDLQVPIKVTNLATGETKAEVLNRLPRWESIPLIKFKTKEGEKALRA